MIEPTRQLVNEFARAARLDGEVNGIEYGQIKDGLTAVLALVERDYFIEQCGRHDDHGRHIWVNPGMYADRQCEGRP